MRRRLKRSLVVGIGVILASLAGLCLVLQLLSFWYCYSAYIGNNRGTSGVAVNFRTPPGALEITGIHFTSEAGRAARGFEVRFDSARWTMLGSHVRHRKGVHGGFGFSRRDETVTTNGPKYTNHYLDISVPFWVLAILCAIQPVLKWNPRRIRRLRLAAGLCPTCGYDLRATPDRCPEMFSLL